MILIFTMSLKAHDTHVFIVHIYFCATYIFIVLCTQMFMLHRYIFCATHIIYCYIPVWNLSDTQKFVPCLHDLPHVPWNGSTGLEITGPWLMVGTEGREIIDRV